MIFTIQHGRVGFRETDPPQGHGGQAEAREERAQVHRVDDGCVQDERTETPRTGGRSTTAKA